METSKITKGKSKTTYFLKMKTKICENENVFANFGPETTKFERKYRSSIQRFEKIIDKHSFA